MTEQFDQARTALERLPQRRVASLYDVAVQYSVLDWYQTVTSGDLDFDLDPTHLAFLTPMAKPGLYQEDDNALVVYVDLQDPDHPQFRENRPVRFETVDESYRYKLGHAYPAKKTSNMTDYSVTTHKTASEWHLSGEREDTYGTANVKDRFTRWPHSAAAEAVLERGHEQAWVIRALQKLGNDSATLDALLEQSDFPMNPEDEDTEHEVFITIRVRLPDSEEYLWPGEIPVLNDVMVEQKAERFENVAVENAGGDGIGFVSGDEGRVTGGSAGLLGMYGKLQREHFPGLSSSGSEAWRSRPVTPQVAAALAAANSLFEEFYRGLRDSRRLYILPYLGGHPDTIAPEQFDAFAEKVFQRLRSATEGDFEAAVGEVFFKKDDQKGDSESLGLFAEDPVDTYEDVHVASVFSVTGEPDRILFENLRTDIYRPREVDVAHSTVLRTGAFGDEGVFEAIRTRSESPLLNPDAGSGREVMALFGSYFEWTTEPTPNSEDAEGTPKAGDIDDVLARRLRSFLSDESIPVATLLEEYLNQIVQRQRKLFGKDGSSGVPTFQTIEQYAQLRALEAIGALVPRARSAGSDATVSQVDHRGFTIGPVTDSQTQATYESRDDRLDAFIEDHGVLAGSEPHQAVFLLGGLVGRISAYQRREDVSSTLVRRYPIDYLTKQSIKEVTNEVLQMNNTYIESDDKLSSVYNARYVNRLPDLMLSSDPSSWTFPQSELQWLYALGIAYGSNDTQIATEE